MFNTNCGASVPLVANIDGNGGNGMFGNDMIPIDECIYNLDEKTVIYNRRRVRNLKWVEENAVIVHFNGKYKPWKECYKGILAPLWFRFRDAEVPLLKRVG